MYELTNDICITNPFIEHVQLQPTYVNMTELATMAASSKNTNSNNPNNTQQGVTTPIPPATQSLIQIQQGQPNSPALSTTSSLVSPDSSATNPLSSVSSPDISVSGVLQTSQNTSQSDSPRTPVVASLNNENSLNEMEKSLVSFGMIDENSVSTTPTNSSPVTTRTLLANTNTDLNNDNKTSTTNTEDMFSPKKDSCIENDVICSGSVIEKASMFEKLEQIHAAEAKATQGISSSCTSLNTQNFSLPSSITNLTPATVARLESIYGKKQEEKIVVEKEAG